MRDQQVPGVSVAVSAHGKLVWSEGFGHSDLETRVPVWPHTKFRVGSISKPLTAAAVALLVERGELDLDAPVRRYVEYWPRKSRPITPRQLAGHLAGIRHYVRDEFLIQRGYDSVRAGIEIFRSDPLLDPPGHRFRYSSYGFNLLSAVVEGASGESFLPYMQREVFEPLGMRHTVADHTSRIIENRTRYYVRGDGKVFNAPFANNSYKWAGGGFLSTPEDLILFARAHLTQGFLKPETIQLLWTSQSTSDGNSTGYGIGWRVSTDAQGRRRVGHGGGSVGGTCQLIMYPEEQVVVAITTNLSGVGFGRLQYQIAEHWLPQG